MKTKELLKLSWLELIRFKNVSFFLVLNLTLGLVGFFMLQIFQQSLAAQSAEKAQVVLGGDLAISSRRAFSEQERLEWESQFKFVEKSQFYNLFTMLRTPEDNRLVSVGVFDSNFPLYGEFKLSGVGFTNDLPRIWVDPEVQETLNLQLNQKVEIGSASFIFSGVVLEDPSRLFRGVGFAPRVFIHLQYLKEAGLIKPGSTFNESWSYKISPFENLSAIKVKLQKAIKDPVVNIENTKDSAQDSNRVLKYFSDYLGLVALVALGLCFLCGTYLLQWTFLTKKKSIAIYKTLGLGDRKIIFIYLFQNLLISLLACFVSYSLVYLAQPVLQSLLLNTFNLPLTLIFNFKATGITAFIAIFGPILMVVPQILEIIELRPLSLLQNVQNKSSQSWAHRIWLLISILIFWLLAVWQSQSFQIAGIFTGAIVALIIFFRYANKFLLLLLEKVSRNWNWLLKYSIRGLTRKPASAALVFTTMSLATLVLSLLPHVKTSIIEEIKPSQSSLVPSLFMFDIQPDQINEIKKMAQETLKQEIQSSPLVRSRILKINEEKYERSILNSEMQTREADQEARFRNRGVNLTYRDTLKDSEVLVEGYFQGHYEKNEKLPEISLSEDYAKRVAIKLGDVITFDVQGLEIKARVGSLRKVRWTSFQPNFFILFPTGVLEEAPQNFLTSVNKSDVQSIKQFQKLVSNSFKNVSIIDITRTIENSLKYIDQMALGLQLMAWLAVIVGLFVFVVLLNTQVKERLQEMNLLQILGATGPHILKIIVTQFLILIVSSIFFGVILGLMMAYIIISYYFNIRTEFDLAYLLMLAAILLPICGAALYWGLKPLKNLNPMDLIRLS